MGSPRPVRIVGDTSGCAGDSFALDSSWSAGLRARAFFARHQAASSDAPGNRNDADIAVANTAHGGGKLLPARYWLQAFHLVRNQGIRPGAPHARRWAQASYEWEFIYTSRQIRRHLNDRSTERRRKPHGIGEDSARNQTAPPNRRAPNCTGSKPSQKRDDKRIAVRISASMREKLAKSTALRAGFKRLLGYVRRVARSRSGKRRCVSSVRLGCDRPNRIRHREEL